MSVINNSLKFWPYGFGFLVGVSLVFFGNFRIFMGISSLRITDAYIAHYMSVGLLYLNMSLLILIALTIGITYSLAKHKK